MTKMKQMFKPEVFELSEDGLLTGTPLVEMLAYPLNFKVTDAKGLVNRKTIPISTDGLIIGYDIVTPNNTLIEWGENVDMNLNLRNATTGTINNLVVSLTCDNPNVTFTDDIQNVGMLNPMQEIDINTAFNFNLNYNFYNEEEITLHLTAEATENTWEIDIVLPVYTSDIITTEYFVDDSDNNRLDIGETSDVYYVFKNNGGAALDNINITVTTVDPFITINTNSDNIGSLIPTQTGNAYFNFTASSECLPGHVALLNFHITGANGYEKDIVGHLSVGQIIENWETNTFDTYNWTLGGDLPWIITDVAPYEGAYCLKSGAITHDQNSTIEIELEVISAGSISFYKKVSSETNYDFLKFYVDGIEKGSWSGTQDWSLQSYGVAAGVRNFKWVYSKDNTVSSGSDCAWIDLIEFPSIYDTEPILTLSTESINKVMYQDEIDVDTMYISNMGGGIIDYNLEILSNISWGKSQKNISGSFMTCSNQSFFAGDAVDWTFTAKNMGTDNEWIEGASANFPEGFMINTVTDMYDESTDTLHLVSGVPGDGADFAWFGEQTDGWGLIQVNETAHFHLTGNISEAFEGNMKVYYTLQGEVYGAEPHIVNDSITILNYGPRVEWFYSSTNNGDLGIGQSDLLLLEFNTWGLTPGIYECNLNVFASCDTVVIPVTLTVLNPVNVGNLLVENFSVYPNPSHDNFVVEAGFKFEKIELVNLLGQVVLSKEISSSKCVIQTSDIVPGVYFVNVFTDSGIRTKKLVIE